MQFVVSATLQSLAFGLFGILGIIRTVSHLDPFVTLAKFASVEAIFFHLLF
jgi:hypothetical protein